MDERELQGDVTKGVKKVWFDKVRRVQSKLLTLSSAMKRGCSPTWGNTPASGQGREIKADNADLLQSPSGIALLLAPSLGSLVPRQRTLIFLRPTHFPQCVYKQL